VEDDAASNCSNSAQPHSRQHTIASQQHVQVTPLFQSKGGKDESMKWHKEVRYLFILFFFRSSVFKNLIYLGGRVCEFVWRVG
jgi:hypothetical protein